MVLKANIYYIFILFSLFSIFFLCVSFIYQFKDNANSYYISILLTHFVFFVYIFQRYFYKKIQYYSSIFTLLYSLKNIFNTQKMAIKINSYYISISFFYYFLFFLCAFHLHQEMALMSQFLLYLYLSYTISYFYLFYKIYRNICEKIYQKNYLFIIIYIFFMN